MRKLGYSYATIVKQLALSANTVKMPSLRGLLWSLKNEMFYGVSSAGGTIEGLILQVNLYMKWYSNERIKGSLGGMSPVEYKKKSGLIT